MNKIPWDNNKDIQEIIKEDISTEDKAEKLYSRIKEYESMANDGFTKPMPCTVEELVDYLEGNNDKKGEEE